MPKLTILVGLPGSGKSTWREKNITSEEVISSDDIIEKYCQEDGITYNEGFSKYAKIANNEIKEKAKKALEQNKDIIWDQTNLSKKSRKLKINMAKKYGYKVVCVVFEVEDSILYTRLKNRPGKEIPDYVIKNMMGNYQFPTKDEKIDQIKVHNINLNKQIK